VAAARRSSRRRRRGASVGAAAGSRQRGARVAVSERAGDTGVVGAGGATARAAPGGGKRLVAAHRTVQAGHKGDGASVHGRNRGMGGHKGQAPVRAGRGATLAEAEQRGVAGRNEPGGAARR
jgi:hypothetical protein